MQPGSSPLSRGIPITVSDIAEKPGIIPALAGNTHRRRSPSPRRGDHPRSRGEYLLPHPHRSFQCGSSPLSRGIRFLKALPVGTGRIIPALAGNTHTPTPTPSSTSDHPRSRGEYDACTVITEYPQGSSPLSRGIHRLRSAAAQSRGIIPALAGNTRCGVSSPREWRDHPRSRGEYTC